MKEFVDHYLAHLGGLLARLDSNRIAQVIEWLRETRHMGRLEDCFFIMTHILAYAFIEGD